MISLMKLKIEGDVTKELIRSEGLDQLNTRRIAEAASSSVGTLCNYFPDFSAILAYVAADYLDEVNREVRPGLFRSTGVGSWKTCWAALFTACCFFISPGVARQPPGLYWTGWMRW
jgi:AcrR family transcriptional regulator